VFISAFPEAQAAGDLEGIEYDAYLVKPVHEDQLASLLDSFGEAS
jgi:two-component SAPR family response regulator